MENKINDMDKNLERVLFYLEDDHATGRKGLVSKLNDSITRLDCIEQDKKLKKQIAAIFGAMGSAFVVILWEGFKYLFKS